MSSIVALSHIQLASSDFAIFVMRKAQAPYGLLLETCPCCWVGFARFARAFAGVGTLLSPWLLAGLTPARVCLPDLRYNHAL